MLRLQLSGSFCYLPWLVDIIYCLGITLCILIIVVPSIKWPLQLFCEMPCSVVLVLCCNLIFVCMCWHATSNVRLILLFALVSCLCQLFRDCILQPYNCRIINIMVLPSILWSSLQCSSCAMLQPKFCATVMCCAFKWCAPFVMSMFTTLCCCWQGMLWLDINVSCFCVVVCNCLVHYACSRPW